MSNSLKNPYEVLKRLYPHEALCSFHPLEYPEFNHRIQSIFLMLRKMRVDRDSFALTNAEDYPNPKVPNYRGPHRLNIYAYPRPFDPKKKTVMLMAHYDVANPAYENVLDNTASVANLIALAHIIKTKKTPVNVVIAFTDAEEIVSFTSSGAKRVADKIKAGEFGSVEEVINLELTAYGSELWSCGNGAIAIHPEIRQVHAPFNDATVLMRNGIPATCIGTLTNNDLQEIETTGGCKTWNACHSPLDTFDQADDIMMNDLVQWLTSYLVLYGEQE